MSSMITISKNKGKASYMREQTCLIILLLSFSITSTTTQSRTSYRVFSTVIRTTLKARLTQRMNLTWRMGSCELFTTQTGASRFLKSTESSCFLQDLINSAILMSIQEIITFSRLNRTTIRRLKSGRALLNYKWRTILTITLLPKGVS